MFDKPLYTKFTHFEKDKNKDKNNKNNKKQPTQASTPEIKAAQDFTETDTDPNKRQYSTLNSTVNFGLGINNLFGNNTADDLLVDSSKESLKTVEAFESSSHKTYTKGLLQVIIKASNSNKDKHVQNFESMGIVTSVKDGVVQAKGLANIASGQLVEFSYAKIKGIALNLLENSVSIVVFGDDEKIKVGDTVVLSTLINTVIGGFHRLGTICDALGEVITEEDKFLYDNIVKNTLAREKAIQIKTLNLEAYIIEEDLGDNLEEKEEFQNPLELISAAVFL